MKKIWEQADRGKGGFIYSWMVDFPFKMRKKMESLGWEWIRGSGCKGTFRTKAPEAVKALCSQMDCIVRTNGTHASLSAPMYNWE
jgi:hypothetical protein